MIASLMLAAAMAGQAQPKDGRPMPPPPHEGGKKGKMHMIDGLTTDQEAQIKKLHTGFRKEMLPLKAEAKTKRAALEQLQLGDNVDQAKVKVATEELFALKARMAVMKADQRQKVRKVLNDEQRVQFDSMLLDRKEGRGKGGKAMHRGRKGECAQPPPDAPPAPRP